MTLKECDLNFTLVSAASTYMVLEPGLAFYSGPTFLIEYQIGKLVPGELSWICFYFIYKKVVIYFFFNYVTAYRYQVTDVDVIHKQNETGLFKARSSKDQYKK